MTDSPRGGGPIGPPWSVDLLADLHAGALDDETSAQLWPRVNADPEARAVIEALDVVKVELGQLRTAPPAPMPAHFAARLDAALDAEARATATRRPPEAPRVAPVVDLAEARRRRNRRIGWAAGVLTAAAAAVAVTIAIFPGSNTTGGNPIAEPTSAGQGAKPPLPVEMNNLSAAIGGVANEKDYGPLKDQAHLDECIKANDIDPTKVQTVGVRQVMLDGKPGVFALLTTGQIGQFRVLIVEPNCTALANELVGR